MARKWFVDGRKVHLAVIYRIAKLSLENIDLEKAINIVEESGHVVEYKETDEGRDGQGR